MNQTSQLNQPKFILCQGISASGKSTYAEELVSQGWVELNRDSWRFKIFCNGVENWGLYRFTNKREQEVTDEITKVWWNAADKRKNVVCSDTNLNPKYVEHWKNEAESEGYTFEVIQFPIPLDEALKRDERRPNSVGSKVIVDQYKQFLKLVDRKTYIPNGNLPQAILVDIDGTLTKMGKRGPFDWAKVGVDTPRDFVMDIIEAYQTKYPSVSVVLLSGRDGVARAETEKWLTAHEFAYDELYMRREGDNRKDSIIKEELFWDIVVPQYQVLFVVDDRPQVVRMWKDLGLNVVDVSESYGEF